ncbi:MAG: hypothetical protein ABI634_19540 [Acidobacteriota bacterium]
MRAGPALLVRLGLFLILLTAAVGTPADADLWGHLRFGQDIVRTGSIVHVDEYSFTSDRPWINHEWLSEVLFAEAYRVAGPTGLILLKLLIISALLALVWRQVRNVAPSSHATFWIVVLAFVGTYWRTHSIRPQLFSVLFFAVLLVVIARADEGRRRLLLIVPPMIALWVNLHGGWIVGLGVLGLWVAFRCVDRRLRYSARAFVAMVGVTAVAATLINPYGVELWRFLAETVRLGRADIQEWGSILTHPAILGVPWALSCLVAVVALARGGRPRHIDYVVIVGLTALASFRVSRLDAFLALAVAILLAPAAGRAWSAQWPSREQQPAGARPGIGMMAITVMALVAMLASALGVVRPSVGCITIGGAWAPDADAGRFIALNRLEGRMLTWFDWGEYAIWHFGPALQVSMDGRRETVYLDRTIQAHQRLYAADESAPSFLQALNPDYIWVSSALPIAHELNERGWTPIFSSPVSRIFARAGRGPFLAVTGPSPVPRCFPGP